MKTLIACSLWTVVVTGLAFEAPVPTRAWEGLELKPQGWSAAPTKAPHVVDLLRRQQNAQGLLVGPDATCGYTSASSAGPWGICCSTCSCAFGTSVGAYGPSFYCCNAASCTSQTAISCLDSTAVSSRCTGGCLTDPSTIKCTVSPNTYCNLVEFQTVSVQALYCDSSKVLSTIYLSTTYAGETGHSYSIKIASSASSSSSKSSSSTATTTASSASTTTTTSTSTSTTTPSPQSTSPSPPPAATNSPAPIGAIVGGTVGGVAVLALVGFFIFFCLRRRSRRSDAASVPPIALQQQPSQYQPFHSHQHQPQPPDEKLGATPFTSPHSPPPPSWSAYDQVAQAPTQSYDVYPQPGGHSQPTPYNPSATTSPYTYQSHLATANPHAVEAQGSSHHANPTVSDFSTTPRSPVAELGPRE